MKRLLLIASTLITLVACNDVDQAQIDEEERIMGEWTTLDSNRNIRTDFTFREDKTYESTIHDETEIRENGSWSISSSVLSRNPSKCYRGADVVSCSNRNDGQIEWTSDGFVLKVHKFDYELDIDTTYVMEFIAK